MPRRGRRRALWKSPDGEEWLAQALPALSPRLTAPLLGEVLQAAHSIGD